MKAKSQAARLKAKRGRPLADGARTPSGQLSRAAEHNLSLEAATWKRRQEKPYLTVEEARSPEHGLVIAKWRQNHLGYAKRFPDKPNEHEFTELQYDTAMKFAELREAWLAAIEAKRMMSSSDLNRTPGRVGGDPFERAQARRNQTTESMFKDARRVILESGPLGMMAIETIVVENQEAESLRGDLRCALNVLAMMWRMASKAA